MATDPFLMPRPFLRELVELTAAACVEVALAREMDLLTTPYVFDPKQAREMTAAGADILVAHMGCTSGGSIGARTVRTLDSCVASIKAIVESAKSVRDDVIVLCHGGPLAQPDDARYVIDRTPGVDGFYGASSTERLPTEVAIQKQIERFKSIRLAR